MDIIRYKPIHVHQKLTHQPPHHSQPNRSWQRSGPVLDASTSTFAKVKDAMLNRRGYPNWMPVSAFSKTRHSKKGLKSLPVGVVFSYTSCHLAFENVVFECISGTHVTKWPMIATTGTLGPLGMLSCETASRWTDSTALQREHVQVPYTSVPQWTPVSGVRSWGPRTVVIHSFCKRDVSMARK